MRARRIGILMVAALVVLLGLLLCFVGCEVKDGDVDDVPPSSDGNSQTLTACETHTFGSPETVESATCTKAGKVKKTCAVCGEVVEESVPAVGHVTGDWEVGAAATCEKAGYRQKKCGVCGEIAESEVLAATGHNQGDWITDKEPSCAEEGKRHADCTVCHQTVATQKLDALSHTPGDPVVVEATCQKKGSTTVKCTECGKTISQRTIAIVPCTVADELRVDTPATCDHAGWGTPVCKFCGDEMGDLEQIPATGHSMSDWIVDVVGNCTTPESKYRNCTACGEAYERVTESEPHHTESDWIIDQVGNCTTDEIKHKDCTVCGETIEESVTVALGHPWDEWVVDIAPTCKSKGAQHRDCTACDATEEGVLDELPHEPSEWTPVTPNDCENNGSSKITCTSCGDTLQTRVDVATGHKFVEKEVVIPDCYNEGLAETRCENCNALQSSRVLPIRHTLGDETEVTKDPTCTETGLAVGSCVICHAPTTEVELPKIPHNPGEETVVAPATCTEDGRAEVHCTECGELLSFRILEKLGHGELSEWIPVTNPTCEGTGTSKRVCTVCGDTRETRVDAAIGHDMQWEEMSTDASRIQEVCQREGCNHTGRDYAKEEYAIESGTTSTITLSGYSIMYPANSSYAMQEKVSLLSKKINGFTGQPVSASSGVQGQKRIQIKIDANDEDLNGHGFVIRKESSAIVIVGSTALTAQMGVDYFMNKYLTALKITIPEKAVSDDYEMITLSGYSVIYDKNTDTRWEYNDANTSNVQDTYYGVSDETGRDFDYDLALTLATLLGTSYKADSTTVSTQEILVGRPARDQVTTALSMIDGHEYIIAVVDGRLVITGYSDAALHKVAKITNTFGYTKVGDKQKKTSITSQVLSGLLVELLNDATVGGNILLPANLRMIGEASDRWLTDVSLPEGLPLYTTADDADGVFQYLYTGSNAVTKTAFDAYVAQLKAEGFSKVLSETSAEGSYFITLTNQEATKMVHVSFEAYAHKSDNTAGQKWAASNPASNAIRVRTSTMQDVELPWLSKVSRPGGSAANKTVKSYESGVYQVYYFYTSKPGTSRLDSYQTTLANQGYVTILRDTANDRLVMQNRTTKELIEAFYTQVNYTVSDIAYTHAICWRYRAPGVVTMPEELFDSTQSYQKITDSKIVSIDLSAVDGKAYVDDSGKNKTLSGSYGTGYVMMLEDGRFVIIDGGSADGGTSNADIAWAQVENFWSIIKALYKDVYGYEPSEAHPAHIAAWIITHAHGDHMNMFWDFTNRYGGGEGGGTLGAYVTIDYLIANTPDFTTQYNTGEPNMTLINEMMKINSYVQNGFTTVKVQTGQKLYLANLEIETLFTHGDLNPQRLVTFNDSSTVQRLNFVRTTDGKGARTVNHKAMGSGSTTSFLSTGDDYIWGGSWMAAMYGSYLKTDMVSVAHHGGPGVTKEFYDLVSPTVVWWSMEKSSAHGGYSTNTDWYSQVDQHLIYNVDSVEYIYVADDYHITLALKYNGPDYGGIYHATDTKKAPLDYHFVSKSDLKTNSNKAREEMCSKKPVAIKKT